MRSIIGYIGLTHRKGSLGKPFRLTIQGGATIAMTWMRTLRLFTSSILNIAKHAGQKN
jgi:hypothetical protein